MKFLLLIWLVFMIVKWISNASSNRQVQQHDPQRRMRITVSPGTVETEDGETLPVWHVTASGTVAVPRVRYPVKVQMRIGDTTDPDKTLPVYCHFNDLSDDDGMFLMEFDLQIPHQISTFEDLELGSIPVFALLPPFRGERKLRVFVDIVDAKDEERAYQAGATTRRYKQVHHGYMEADKRSLEQEAFMGQLALAFSASDGTIDKTETAVLKRRLGEAMAAREADDEAKRKLSGVLKRTRDDLTAGKITSAELVKRLCAKIMEYESPGYSQAAYELCVQVVAADGVVEEEESAHLKDLAQLLEIPPELTKELHERNLRLSMYAQRSEESLIDMPAGLSREDKIAFLNREYQKWRSRATHEKEEVQLEASRRLELITRLRRELADE
ncbi:MAG: tellurite resistance TerB family protein [Planctomycetota bacterium]|jgi:tellurite resistance protein